MRRLDYILYAAVIFAWSTSWLPLKWQLGVVSPEVSLLWRFIIATVMMTLITIAMGHSLKTPLKEHLKFFGLGICLFSMNFSLYYYAGLYATSGLLAVVFRHRIIGEYFLCCNTDPHSAKNDDDHRGHNGLCGCCHGLQPAITI